MNRLEEEYKQLRQSETPDLWERIEAGIDAINDTQADRVREAVKKGINENTNKGTYQGAGYRKHKKERSFFRKYSLPLAACIAAVLCVPLIAAGFLRTVGSRSESASDADLAAEEEYFALTAESYEEAEVENCEEAACEDTASNENTAEKEAKEDALTEDAAPEEEPVKNSGNSDGGQQTITITGYSQGKEDLQEGRGEGSILEVITAEQGECSVFVPADAVFSLPPDQPVRIVVEPGNGDYDYLFVEMAE